MAEVSIWATSTDMAGTQYQRKTYFMILRDGDEETKFSLQVHADKTIVAAPYVTADYGYTDYDDDGLYPEDDDDCYCDDDWDEDDGYDGGVLL